jgi:hypothetical protein
VRLIYYSLVRCENQKYDRQWVESIRSLRRYNRELPVCLMVYNSLSEEILEEASRNDVMVVYLGDYAETLSRTYPRGSILSLYPTLHKFISLRELDTSGCSQILYVDCDTFFFDDPAVLFSTYNQLHWYAREAPASRRCPHGYNPENIDEHALESIFRRESLSPVHPFNAGVCLLNYDIWKTFEKLQEKFLDNLWRILVGRHLDAPDGSDDHIRNAVLAHTTEVDRARALPYPSHNFWIAEEIALWITLGSISGLSQGFISWDHVAQGDEFRNQRVPSRHRVLAHYFSSMQQQFFNSLEQLNR